MTAVALELVGSAADATRRPMCVVEGTDPVDPSMMVASAFSSRSVGLGLDRPLSLRGADRSVLARLPLDLGFFWQPDFRSLVETAIEGAVASISEGLTLPPMILTGPAGVGRTHVARRLAQLCDVPHVAFDLAHPEAERQLLQHAHGVRDGHAGSAGVGHGGLALREPIRHPGQFQDSGAGRAARYRVDD